MARTDQDSITESFAASDERRGNVGLVIVHHPDATVHGASLAPVVGESYALGRHSVAFGPDRLAVAAVSRNHATVACSGVGALSIVDHGSRNGTFHNGGRVTEARLRLGDTVRLGSVLMVVDHCVASNDNAVQPLRLPGFVGFSPSWTGLARVAAALRGREEPVLVWGPRGSGRHALCRALAGDERVILPEPGLAQWPDSGVVIVEVSRWPASALSEVEVAIESRGARCILVSKRPPSELQSAGVSSQLLSVVAPWTLHVPPLAERPADIAAVVWELVRRYRGDSARPTLVLLERLLRTPLATDAHHLDALVERAVVESDGDDIDLFDGFDAAVVVAEPLPQVTLPPASLVIARSGAWFHVSGAPRTDLASRPLLQRLTRALLEAHTQQRGVAMDVDALFAAGWPGDVTGGRPRTNRVYVALTKLRKLGLSRVLRRTAAGYGFDPTCSVEVAEDGS